MSAARVAVVLAFAFPLAGCAARDRIAGQPCDSDDNCAPGTTCAAVQMLADGSYVYECVELCVAENGYRCPDGELCWPARGDRIELLGCFPGGTDALGERCTYVVNCERGLTCEFDATADGSVPNEGTCVPGCSYGPCREGDACRYLVGDCDEGLHCAPVRLNGVDVESECVPDCTLVAGTAGLCDDGRTCVGLYAAGPETGCVPGGDQPLGAPCEYTIECVRGAVCVSTPSGAGECALACNDSADCPDSTACVDSHCD